MKKHPFAFPIFLLFLAAAFVAAAQDNSDAATAARLAARRAVENGGGDAAQAATPDSGATNNADTDMANGADAEAAAAANTGATNSADTDPEEIARKARLAAVAKDVAASNNLPGSLASLQIITQKNIFDPRRRPWTGNTPPPRPVVVETFTLRGTAKIIDKGSPTFSVDEIKDFSKFVNSLKGQSDPVSVFLWQGLSSPEQAMLTNYQPSATNSFQLKDILVQALNKMVGGKSIYERERFQGILLRRETTSLMGQSPTGTNLARLNRLLLEDAYPRELSRNLDKGYVAFFVGDGVPTYPATRCVGDHVNEFIIKDINDNGVKLADPKSTNSPEIVLEIDKGQQGLTRSDGGPWKPAYYSPVYASATVRGPSQPDPGMGGGQQFAAMQPMPMDNNPGTFVFGAAAPDDGSGGFNGRTRQRGNGGPGNGRQRGGGFGNGGFGAGGGGGGGGNSAFAPPTVVDPNAPVDPAVLARLAARRAAEQ